MNNDPNQIYDAQYREPEPQPQPEVESVQVLQQPQQPPQQPQQMPIMTDEFHDPNSVYHPPQQGQPEIPGQPEEYAYNNQAAEQGYDELNNNEQQQPPILLDDNQIQNPSINPELDVEQQLHQLHLQSEHIISNKEYEPVVNDTFYHEHSFSASIQSQSRPQPQSQSQNPALEGDVFLNTDEVVEGEAEHDMIDNNNNNNNNNNSNVNSNSNNSNNDNTLRSELIENEIFPADITSEALCDIPISYTVKQLMIAR
jgi:hypothetical protein